MGLQGIINVGVWGIIILIFLVVGAWAYLWFKQISTKFGEKFKKKQSSVAPKTNTKSQSYYSDKKKCDNCGAMNTFNIPAGITIGDFLASNPCIKCGCVIKNKK